MSQLKKREEIEEKFTWAMQDMCSSDEKWEEELEALKGFAEKYSEFEGKLGSSAKTLCEFLKFEDKVGFACEIGRASCRERV